MTNEALSLRVLREIWATWQAMTAGKPYEGSIRCLQKERSGLYRNGKTKALGLPKIAIEYLPWS